MSALDVSGGTSTANFLIVFGTVALIAFTVVLVLYRPKLTRLVIRARPIGLTIEMDMEASGESSPKAESGGDAGGGT